MQLQQARALQQSEAFGEYRQRRVVEYRLPRLVQLRIRQSRYFGRAKTRFQLLPGGRGGQPDPSGRQGRPASRHWRHSLCLLASGLSPSVRTSFIPKGDFDTVAGRP